MAISIYQLGYKKLSQIIFEWQIADRTSLLALFIFIVALHWLWFLVVWLCRDTVEPYVDMHLFYPLWLGVTITGVLLWWMIGYLSRIKSNYKTITALAAYISSALHGLYHFYYHHGRLQ